MEPRTSELGDASAAARGSQLPELPTWEELLGEVELGLNRHREHVAPAERNVRAQLLLVIALQLRELLEKARPLLEHPLLRR